MVAATSKYNILNGTIATGLLRGISDLKLSITLLSTLTILCLIDGLILGNLIMIRLPG